MLVVVWLLACVCVAQGYFVGWLIGKRDDDAAIVEKTKARLLEERARADAAEGAIEEMLTEHRRSVPRVSVVRVIKGGAA